MEDKFYLDRYISAGINGEDAEHDFDNLCEKIAHEFQSEWENQSENVKGVLETQKKAIIGYEKEKNYFLNKIRETVKKRGAQSVEFPRWYNSLEEAVYHENWGLAGIAQWFGEKYASSSSAKIIGENIYFMEHGRMVLKPQKITPKRREQLVRAFLLLTPEERINRDFHEVYMLDGTRVTVFGGNMVKDGQDVIVFRRYIVPVYSFEEQVKRGTIPKEAAGLFENMVRLGYNCAFTGAPRSSKTTFLTTWQSLENPDLEGVMVETDPEIPLHKIMPGAPIVQLIADEEALGGIVKNILRSDADYVIMAEARDGTALDTVLRLAAKGTRRMKITFHSRNPLAFPYDVADEITRKTGGATGYNARRAAGSFDYIFHFVQLADKSQKRLNSIHEISLDRASGEIKFAKICSYDYASDSWKWFYSIGDEKRAAGLEENREAFEKFDCDLKRLAQEGEKNVNGKIHNYGN
ncbi:MAG: CpaF/VirB11 family protein [Clostridia bacterium]|nr:CpaF/VirB11 family protein [Clostridia bacterium]